MFKITVSGKFDNNIANISTGSLVKTYCNKCISEVTTQLNTKIANFIAQLTTVEKAITLRSINIRVKQLDQSTITIGCLRCGKYDSD